MVNLNLDNVCKYTLFFWRLPLTKPGSGGFLVSLMFKQVLISEIEHLQEQELEKKLLQKNIQEQVLKNSLLVPA